MCIRDRSNLLKRKTLGAAPSWDRSKIAPSANRRRLHIVINKRQILTEILGKHSDQFLSLPIIGGTLTPGPVSYTHLDVYKRQTSGKACAVRLNRLGKSAVCGLWASRAMRPILGFCDCKRGNPFAVAAQHTFENDR